MHEEKLEYDVRKNRSIKPKIRWKAKKLPDAWQGQHQVLEVQQALKSIRFIPENSGFRGFFMFVFENSSDFLFSLLPLFASVSPDLTPKTRGFEVKLGLTPAFEVKFEVKNQG